MAREVGMPMCAEMVLAIRDGRKTESRRVCRINPSITGVEIVAGRLMADGPDGKVPVLDDKFRPVWVPCQPGQRLWFREGLHRQPDWDYVWYRADDESVIETVDGEPAYMLWRWKRDFLPSIFMPKDCCRFWRIVTSLRVERLTDIPLDALFAEGAPTRKYDEAARWFRDLWNRLNEKRGYGWDSNPWVWVVQWQNDDGTGAAD